jgi:3-oxocholest-4-en-26-oyl-CoA dehydrogenase alpha subunit
MDFRFSAEEESLRHRVREFLQGAVSPRWQELSPVIWEESEEAWALKREFEQKLGRLGWLAPQYPPEYGGLGASVWETVVLREEMAYHRAPVGWDTEISVNWVGPSILLYGSEEQRLRYARGIAQGDLVFCLGYSEPAAGSDLASLETVAREDGDTYVINGQKTFTSLAHWADYCWLIAKTDEEAPPHRGMSLFIVDMKSPGITVTPLVNVLGSHSFNQVYFDGVRVSRQNLVGEKNRGWYQLMTALSFERSGVLWPAENRRLLEELAEMLRHEAERLDPAARRQGRLKLSDLAVANEVLHLLCYRVAWLQSRGQTVDAEVSIAFVFGSEMVRRIANEAVNLLGLFGQLGRGSARAPLAGRVEQNYLASLVAGIGGGTLEIQRNIIAGRGLGLPRG